MIRDKYRKEILKTIDGHKRFESSDFVISTKSVTGGTELTIVYSIEKKFKIVIKIPNSSSRKKDDWGDKYYFKGTASPGPLALNESFDFEGIESMYSQIKTWLDCIWEELISNPLVKRIESQQDEINKIFTNFESIPDEYFSVEEADDLRGRLDKLESDFKKQINDLVKDKKEAESEIASLHDDIDTLKQSVESFKKKTWFKGFATKVYRWTSKPSNRKMLKNGYKVIREFLPEEVKASVPDID